MAKAYKKSNGFIYVAANENMPGLIKIGEAKNADDRMNGLSGHSGVPGKFKILWRQEVQHPQAMEKVLHDLFQQFHTDKEFYRINDKEAIKILNRVFKVLKPVVNEDLSLLGKAVKHDTTRSTNEAKQELWNRIKVERQTSFLKQTIELCLREKRYGQPQYDRFSAIRSDKLTKIGRFDLYVCKGHLRIVVTTTSRGWASKTAKEKISSTLKVTTWERGISFYIKNADEFKAFKKWIRLGEIPHGTKYPMTI